MIQPVFRHSSQNITDSTAGKTNEIRISPAQSMAPGTMAAAPFFRAWALGSSQPVQIPSWPHRPQVPIPELMGAPFISSLNRQVAMGPVMAEVRVGGIQIRGFFTILGICSMEVPIP